MLDLGFESHGDRETNAQLIVTAVNTHAESIRLLKEAHALLMEMFDRDEADEEDAELEQQIREHLGKLRVTP
jgi:hypothetical protein